MDFSAWEALDSRTFPRGFSGREDHNVMRELVPLEFSCWPLIVAFMELWSF